MCSCRDVITVECLDGRILNSLMMASTEGPKHEGVIDQ